MMKPETCRAGRGLLGLTQAELAASAMVGLSTLRSFEKGDHAPNPANLAAIKKALEDAGVIFLGTGDVIGGCAGVRLRD